MRMKIQKAAAGQPTGHPKTSKNLSGTDAETVVVVNLDLVWATVIKIFWSREISQNNNYKILTDKENVSTFARGAEKAKRRRLT